MKNIAHVGRKQTQSSHNQRKSAKKTIKPNVGFLIFDRFEVNLHCDWTYRFDKSSTLAMERESGPLS